MTQPLSSPELLPPDPMTSSAASAPSAIPASPSVARAQRARMRGLVNAIRLFAILLLVLFGLLAALWWNTHTNLKLLRVELAQRLVAGDTLNGETRGIVKAAQDGIKDVQSRIAVIESKQNETQSQQLALDQLYQDLSKNRDDWALAEIEQVLSTASQQLQLAGNVPGALIALQNADARLSRSDKPQFITIRRSIGHDMDKLKALPLVDMTGLALRLDSIIAQIDGMPLLADEKPALPAAAPRVAPVSASTPAQSGAAATTSSAVVTPWYGVLNEKWQSLSSEVWNELRQLVRVRTVSTPDALLLSPTEAYYSRENLKLRLLNARLALLSRNEPAFRSDLAAAQVTIAKYFDTRARQTVAVQGMLRQVQGSDLTIELPTLAESLNAVRNYKAKP